MQRNQLFLLLFLSIVTTTRSQSNPVRIFTRDIPVIKFPEVLRITTIVNRPFLMLKENSENLKGNDRYEGFIPDLLFELSKLNNFNYVIKEVADGTYGNVMDGVWTGMPGEILSGAADMAAADMTITRRRLEVLDFTIPFMTSGLGILGKTPGSPEVDPWFFLKPFSSQVWLCTFIAFLGVTVFLFILGRFSGADWYQTNPPENNLKATNTLYFVFASLVLQNSKIAPRGTAPRVLSCVWWAFSLFMFCCYLSNLSAILNNKLDALPTSSMIANVEELAQQSKVKYGMLKGGSTFSFFEHSQLPLYQLMFNVMANADPPVLVESYKEGVEKVRQGNYAFVMESTTISYLTAQDCDFMQIGGLLDSRGYGLALKKNSSLTSHFSSSILKLQEEGTLIKLREKWWKKGTCSQEVMDDAQGSLNISHVRGVFIFLLIGLLAAFLIAILELFWKVRSKEGRGPLCNEIISESKNALCGDGPNPKTNGKRNGRHDDGIILERQDVIIP